MVLVDTSVWIDYFKNGESTQKMNTLIDNSEICINDVILSELIPAINLKREEELLEQILSLPKIPISINWTQIIDFQTQNLFHGINKVGLPDLMILQNALDNNIQLFSLDKHFTLMAKLFGLRLY